MLYPNNIIHHYKESTIKQGLPSGIHLSFDNKVDINKYKLSFIVFGCLILAHLNFPPQLHQLKQNRNTKLKFQSQKLIIII